MAPLPPKILLDPKRPEPVTDAALPNPAEAKLANGDADTDDKIDDPDEPRMPPDVVPVDGCC